jgi:hypothetical protein
VWLYLLFSITTLDGKVAPQTDALLRYSLCLIS